jgi:hypothetical protein
MSMLKLTYACGNINWEEGMLKNIHLATFAQGLKNLLDMSATVQATQLASLFTTVFTTKTDDDDGDDTYLKPLNGLMSLSVFPPKITKVHLNARFQSIDLKVGFIYKSASIHPFHCAPQTNHAMMKVVSSELEEKQNKINWRINEKDEKQTTSIIKGVRQINLMEDVCMTCTNMCGEQLMIVDVLRSKALLY